MIKGQFVKMEIFVFIDGLVNTVHNMTSYPEAALKQ